MPLTSVTPSTWSRTEPAAARDGPDSPAATMPPTVDAGCEARRLEREALALLGEQRFEVDQRACRRAR